MSGCRCCGGEDRHRETCLIPENAALRAENERLRRLFTVIIETVRSPQEIAAEALAGQEVGRG